MSSFPEVPGDLKAIKPYIKIASDHEKRDPVVTYWCIVYALQVGLKLEYKPKECFAYLTHLMDWLEVSKKQQASNEAVTSEVVAQAHMENYALKLFLWADSEDRASRFSKNLIKTFYTAGLLFDVLTVFGEASEEIANHRKYSKWKATYIHNCLNQGITPVPGPAGSEEETGEFSSFQPPSQPEDNQPSTSTFPISPPPPVTNFGPPPQAPAVQSYYTDDLHHEESSALKCQALNGKELSPEDLQLGQKLCKWAGSALTYEDVPTAVENLQKALSLLTTGQKP